MAKRTRSERWRPVALPGFGEHYQISDRGRVRSRKSGAWRIVRQTRSGSGYLRVDLWRNGVRDQLFVHLLVLAAFVGARPSGCHGAHFNGDRDDNRLDNLGWVIVSENLAHRRHHGRMPSPQARALAKLNPRKVRAIRRAAPFVSQAALSKRYGISQSLCSQVVTRIAWRHVV